MLPAAATGLHGLFPILREVSGIAPGATAAMAAFTALAAGFHRTGPIVREVAGTALATKAPGARGLFPVFGEIPAIAGRVLL